jgi:mannose-6-phosphate isomerase-like protein (cupin superfamily)
MAVVIGRDDVEARALLDGVGVRLHRADAVTADAPADVVRAVLPEDSRGIRAVADIEVSEDVDAGMGAWHVNAVDELHLVQSGEGIMEFVTLGGVVSVVIGTGDVIEVRGAEHRYRPLTEQRWALRFSGGPEADLAATETGRGADPWPPSPTAGPTSR